jgi:UMF1 family MFS transporter
VAQAGFIGANVFYDGFLPAITTDDTIDRVSSRGYALGYVGGGIQLLLAALVILFHGNLGLTEAGAARLGIAMAGVWWFGFGWYAFSLIPEVGSASPLPDRYAGMPRIAAYTTIGFRRTTATARRLLGFKHLTLFVIAFMFFNDGVQTIINLSAVYAADTLELSAATILGALLVVQFVAYAGALVFGWLAGLVGPKPALMASLVGWIVAAVAAFAVPAGAVAAFYAVAAAVGFILGGVQALARSLYGSMIPEEASAEFYGFYAVFAKFSAIWGPLIFAVISGATGSGRPAILSIVLFFVVGLVLLARVDVDEARASRARWAFDDDRVRAAGDPR